MASAEFAQHFATPWFCADDDRSDIWRRWCHLQHGYISVKTRLHARARSGELGREPALSEMVAIPPSLVPEAADLGVEPSFVLPLVLNPATAHPLYRSMQLTAQVSESRNRLAFSFLPF